MSEFTASNGLTVAIDQDGDFVIRDSRGRNMLESCPWLDEDDMKALREFFVKENDDRLGRWRWPDWPEHVVYPQADGRVLVLNESDADFQHFSREEAYEFPGLSYRSAARAFFDAHPVPKPAWHDAKPGEVWRFETADDRRHALGWVAGEGTWDLLTPRGESVIGVVDPMAYLLETWGDEFEGATATRFVPEVQS